MSYTQIPMVELSIAEISLDLKNYRIPSFPDDEEGALSYLFASEDVLTTAKMILRDGYFDNEVPIVVAENGEHIVIEGNRRVSALKALQNPDMAGNHAAEVRALLKRFRIEAENLPNRIRVLLAPDRVTADPHIARLHTGRSKRPWSRDQQATFYYSLLSDTFSVDDIRAHYPGVTVPRFIRMAASRRFLTGVKFHDASLHDYVSGDKLKMSSFEYAYKNSEISTQIGLNFSDQGLLEPTNAEPGAIGAKLASGSKAALEYLLGEFRANRLNTRSPEFKKNSTEEADLLATLKSVAQSANGAGTSSGEPTSGGTNGTGSTSSGGTNGTGSTSSGGTNGAGSTSSGGTNGADATEDESGGPSAAGGKRGSNHPYTKAYLDLTGLDYNTNGSVNLKVRYHELRTLNLVTNPAAAAMYVRSLLETTIKYHFEKTGAPVVGELSSVIQKVEEAYGKNRHLRSSIALIRSGKIDQPGAIQWFNLIAHSADFAVNAQQVHHAWGQLNPLLRHLLSNAKKAD